MTISTDPNQTSGSAKTAISSYSYPLNEALSSSTRLRFVKYSRFNPADPGSETTTATITLPLPINVPDNYGIDVEGMDLGIWGNLNDRNLQDIVAKTQSSGGSVEDALKTYSVSGISAITKMIKDKNFITSLAAAGAISVLGENNRNLVGTFTGKVINPHTTVIFKGVQLRIIHLEWKLSPRSEQESRALQNIYNTIKLRSHPEEIANGFALDYPDLVYVEFAGKAKPYLPIYQKAFVTSINITPDSSGGGMNMFKTGAPISYGLSLTASELSILTRNTLQDQQTGGEIITT